MSFDFKRRGHSFSPYSLYDYISRKFKENILDDYQHAWDVNNESAIRSCEQQLIKLDKKTLVGYLQQFVRKPSQSPSSSWVFQSICIIKQTFIKQTENKYSSCVLHLTHVFCIPGQEEKMKVVQVELNKMLEYCTEEERFDIFERYLSQQLNVRSNLTDKDLLTGLIDPNDELLLKLCYWDIFCAKRKNECCKEFLQQNVDYLVSNIEKSFQVENLEKEKIKIISCTMLLCLLNWNTCKIQTPVTLQNLEAPASSSDALVADTSTNNYSFTAYKVSNILQKILSTLSKDDIFTVFNNYINKMYAMKSDLTEDEFFTSKIDPYNEFLLKFCYCETLCSKNDAFCIEFLRRNADLFVSQIELVVDGENKKLKPISCTILLCLLKFNMCTLKTTPLMVQNTEIQTSSSEASVADTSPIYYYTANTIWSLLKTLLSTFSEDDLFRVFNGYLHQIYAINSEIKEDDLCTGKIEPYDEFLLKLCYCEKLCFQKDEKNLKTFLRRNADFLVPQIKESVNGEKTKLISCKVLLYLLKWGITYQNTANLSLENILSHTLTFKAYYQDFINQNVPFFLSMVGTEMKTNNTPVLILLCDVLLCIHNNELYFHDISGAVNKLIRYYGKQVGINQKIIEWIMNLGYKILKHLYDNQNLDTAIKTEIDFQNLFNLLEDLCTNQDSKSLHLVIRSITYHPPLFLFHFFQHGTRNEAFELRLNGLWTEKVQCKMKAILIKKKGREISIFKHENLIPIKFLKCNITMTEDDFIAEWEADQLDAQNIEAQLKEIEMADEMVKKLKLLEMLVQFTMLFILGTSNGHYKSAKLKKYLSLKYEYDKASLYLLWCSGDIEVHPGPSLSKQLLAHDSSIERRWVQNISPKIIIRLPELLQSKYTATKKVRCDRANRDHFKALLKKCLEEKLHVPKMYLAEINARETMEYKLLHKLFVYRCEVETIITSLQDFFICGGSPNDLTDINISFQTQLKTNEITTILGKDYRPTDKSQLMVYITRFIAGILIKCAHGKDPDAKCDGLWDLPLKNWLTGIILFDPNNRGKYSKKYPRQKLISDQELVDILITLPQVTIPQKYTNIVDAYKLMRNSKTKQHKEQLCTTFKWITSLEKLEYALKNLWESGIFTEEVHNNLNKWWTTGALDTADDQKLSQVNIIEVQTRRRPHILINISTKSITLTVEQTDANSSQMSYDFPLKDELVPLKTMATTVHQTTIQKPSSDSYQMVTAKKYLTVSSKEDACPADNQTYSIIIPPLGPNPNSQAIMESDIKHQHKISTEETALCSTIDFDQPTSSTKQISQLSQNIATPNQSTTNSDDISSATKDSQSLDFHMQVSPTSDIGSSDSISMVNSESGNEERDQNNTLSEGQDPLTDSDYSSDSSNNCVPKTGLKKRKCIEEDRIEMKKRKIPSLKEDKKQSDPTNHRKDDSSMDNSTIFNTNMELLQDCLQIDLDSFVFDDQTFDVKLNALDYEDKNPQICDKDGNLMNGETQMSNENTNISAYNTSVSTILEKFVQDMINKEHEKMSQMKTSLSEV